MSDSSTNIDELKSLVADFRDARNWSQHHSAKNLAISISLEAAELLEHFQWKDEMDKKTMKEVTDELADIVIYCLFLAESNGIDISNSVRSKLEKAAEKYPVEKFADNSLGSDEYYRTKADHRKKRS